MTRRLIAVCVITLFVATALGQARAPDRGVSSPQPRSSNTIRLLNHRVPEVGFDEVPFEQVMDWVAELTGANVVVRWQVLEDAGIERDKPITIKLKNLRLSQVLWMIMNEAAGSDLKLAYRASGSLLILSTEEDLSQEMVLKVYDVGDLLTSPRYFTNAAQLDPGQALNQQGQGGGGSGGGTQLFQSNQNQNENNERQDQGGGIEELITLITDTVEPDSWVDNGGTGQIYAFRNNLVVYASLLVHQRIGGHVREAAIGP